MSLAMAHSFAGARIPVRARPSLRRSRSKRSITPRAAVELPPLPYDMKALEPHMSADTLSFHWGKHHRAYVDNLNKQIAGTPLDKMDLEQIIYASWNDGRPTKEFNNAAQVWNHTFFWNCMKPGGGGQPTGELMEAIKRDFKSYEEFTSLFKQAGATQFGSGWAWLVSDDTGRLTVIQTPNAENTLSRNAGTALLTMDVWEHAYYLDVQNRRPDYINTFVEQLIDWDAVAARYKEVVSVAYKK